MLVDMNAVIPCMVVSSTFSSVRLPINRVAPERIQAIVGIQRLSASGEQERYALSPRFGRSRKFICCVQGVFRENLDSQNAEAPYSFR